MRCRSGVFEKRPGGAGPFGGGGGEDPRLFLVWIGEGTVMLDMRISVKGVLFVWLAAGGVSRMPYGVWPWGGDDVWWSGEGKVRVFCGNVARVETEGWDNHLL